MIGKPGCHLCEAAREVVERVAGDTGVDWRELSILDDAELADPAAIDALLRRALLRASVKDASSEVAAATGRPRREIYQRALALSEGNGRAE